MSDAQFHQRLLLKMRGLADTAGLRGEQALDALTVEVEAGRVSEDALLAAWSLVWHLRESLDPTAQASMRAKKAQSAREDKKQPARAYVVFVEGLEPETSCQALAVETLPQVNKILLGAGAKPFAVSENGTRTLADWYRAARNSRESENRMGLA